MEKEEFLQQAVLTMIPLMNKEVIGTYEQGTLVSNAHSLWAKIKELSM